jgi:hypothetical protein
VVACAEMKVKKAVVRKNERSIDEDRCDDFIVNICVWVCECVRVLVVRLKSDWR